MRQREHGPTTPPDVQLQDDMGPIASHAPGSFARGGGREQGRDHFLRRLGRLEPRARGATTGLLHEIRRTNLAAAIAARGLMRSAGGLAAYGTGAHLVRCEDRLRLGHARRAVLFADEAARTVSPAQVPGALNLSVHGAHGLVRGADRSAAARALHHLVHAHGLVGAALAMAQTRRAQSPAPLGRVRLTLLRMAVTNDPAATAAGFETRGTRRMLAPPVRVRADAFMRRAVRHAARRAQARVLLAR